MKPQRHDRVAFPLPQIPLSFQASRPKLYPEDPKTLGEHLLRRRAILGLRQRDVADQLGVNEFTCLSWERGLKTPLTRFYPAIFRFLGYDPFPEPKTLPERIANKRRHLGWTVEQAAAFVDVDVGTFARWESGEWKPRISADKVKRFIEINVLTGKGEGSS